jgi:hypothetical protein
MVMTVVPSPVLLGMALLVKDASRGAVLYRQERVGKDGRHFQMIKFRSMVANAHARLADVLADEGADMFIDKPMRLRHVIDTFKDHPGLGIWKGDDEPEWGKQPVPNLERAYTIIKEQDPHHPVWIVEAPRGTIDTLRAYSNPKTRDITGVDIYPVSFPPGIHSLLPNDEISLTVPSGVVPLPWTRCRGRASPP